MSSVPSRSAAIDSYDVVVVLLHFAMDGKFRPFFGSADDMVSAGTEMEENETVSLFLSLRSERLWVVRERRERRVLNEGH